jgi:hypothetical protein
MTLPFVTYATFSICLRGIWMEYSLVIIIRGQCCIKYLSMINKWFKLRHIFHVGMSGIDTKEWEFRM